jgi:hypothetical protein
MTTTHVLPASSCFSGSTDDYDNWEREVLAYLKDATNNDRDRLAVIKNALGGADLAVLQSHQTLHNSDLENKTFYSGHAIGVLKTVYVDRDLIETVEFKIRNLKMNKDFDLYTAKFRSLASKLDTNNATLCIWFEKGLQYSIRQPMKMTKKRS